MADEGSSNTGIVAILVIFIVIVGGAFAWKTGLLGGGDTSETKVNVELKAPAEKSGAAPATAPAAAPAQAPAAAPADKPAESAPPSSN